MKAFISYSHKDEQYLLKLKTALAQIRRQGLLQEWSDHEIEAGGKLDETISSELENSELFIALLSPDYIGSHYCYEKEFERAQKLEKAKKLKIVPVICRPCDWKHTPFKELKALPKDGKAISEWKSEDSAYFDIAQALRNLLEKRPENETTVPERESQSAVKQSAHKYKVKKEFDIVQKSDFIDNTFKDAKELLKDYLEELSKMENVRYKVIDDDNEKLKAFLVNRDMGIAECECVFRKGEAKADIPRITFYGTDLTAVFKKGNQEETIGFGLGNDDYKMFFTLRDFSHFNKEEKYADPKPIADKIWGKWLSQIGIDIY